MAYLLFMKGGESLRRWNSVMPADQMSSLAPSSFLGGALPVGLAPGAGGAAGWLRCTYSGAMYSNVPTMDLGSDLSLALL